MGMGIYIRDCYTVYIDSHIRKEGTPGFLCAHCLMLYMNCIGHYHYIRHNTRDSNYSPPNSDN
ncbi:hypothetical protein BBBOND_0304480 [Babesia bigemina]|uniref:Uncharacterized protein n=1 Tax=Babesia bigemina TaxID=5866 RepID=A0A061DDT1_BABBI|nr:hypothetical protein BBBOND_0304480 [Babesia bigemina]CDR96545.1 hypothetical protein BBBOND_0304480 [Babesia bigemina]|eukprot:XP_012768731.1 hypothetical protein BBBOND_0304480 [Babesia bigemina]